MCSDSLGTLELDQASRFCTGADIDHIQLTGASIERLSAGKSILDKLHLVVH